MKSLRNVKDLKSCKESHKEGKKVGDIAEALELVFFEYGGVLVHKISTTTLMSFSPSFLALVIIEIF
jgi:hypothetical protein